MFNNFSRRSCLLWDNAKKYGRAGQDTDDNIIRRMCFACWITKATDTHSEYVILVCVSVVTMVTRTRLSVKCTTVLLSLEICAVLGFTQCRLIVSYRRFGTTYRSYLQRSSSRRRIALPLKMDPIGCREASVRNCESALLRIPKERRSKLHRGGSLKSCYHLP
jgi:hypothetical protein